MALYVSCLRENQSHTAVIELRSGRSNCSVTFVHRDKLAHNIVKVGLQPQAVVNFISRLLGQHFSGTK